MVSPPAPVDIDDDEKETAKRRVGNARHAASYNNQVMFVVHCSWQIPADALVPLCRLFSLPKSPGL